VIEPGAVFEIPAPLADPPQRRHDPNAPIREHRWVLVVSNKADCRDRYQETVVVVLLSAKTEYAHRHDVLIRRPDGGLSRDSIAQTDLVFVVEKAELTPGRHRGSVMADTLRQVRSRLSDTLGISPDA
jgi:mRNA-degrading endonuclease toxin of MazEF toxin-antitoxin module